MSEQQQGSPSFNEEQRKEIQRRIEQNKREIDEIFSLTNVPGIDPFSDSELDRFNEEISLTEYREYNPPKHKFVGAVNDCEPKFPKDYYRNLHRLLGLSFNDESLLTHPLVLAYYTVLLVYARFPSDTLRLLRRSNPRNENGVRIYKHHHLLTNEGIVLLRQFIQDATELMPGFADWHSFYKAFCIKYNQPYQLDLFNADTNS